MTNLELMICEAENAGEIDLDTRDQLLEVLTEGANIEIMRKKKEIKKQYRSIMKEITQNIKSGDTSSASKKIDELIKLLESAIDGLSNVEYTTFSAVISWFIGPVIGNIGRWLLTIALAVPTFGVSTVVSEIKMVIETIDGMSDIIRRKKKNDEYDSLNVKDFNFLRTTVTGVYKQYIKQLKTLKSKLGDSEDKTTKESVLEEIYEAELCGDITPEERMSLIDYMNE